MFESPASSDTILWWIVILAIFATYVWRFLGAFFARNIEPSGDLFNWVTCVSYAMLAGLIVRMIISPAGSLQTTPLWIRLAGVIIGMAVYFLARKQVLAGVGAGMLSFVTLVSVFN